MREVTQSNTFIIDAIPWPLRILPCPSLVPPVRLLWNSVRSASAKSSADFSSLAWPCRTRSLRRSSAAKCPCSAGRTPTLQGGAAPSAARWSFWAGKRAEKRVKEPPPLRPVSSDMRQGTPSTSFPISRHTRSKDHGKGGRRRRPLTSPESAWPDRCGLRHSLTRRCRRRSHCHRQARSSYRHSPQVARRPTRRSYP